jgi:hypothetical protein
MRTAPLPDEVLRALAECGRGPGWNNRCSNVRRFELTGRFGERCTLYVVPFRCWANRRIERQAQAWRNRQARA